MKTTFKTYDVADYLKSEEDMALYLEACFEEAGDDAAFIATALGDTARAKGMSDRRHRPHPRRPLPHPVKRRQPQLQRDPEGDEGAWIEGEAGGGVKSLSNTEFQRFETHIEVSPQLLSVLTIQRLATGLDQLAVEPSNWWHAIEDFDLALMSQLIAFLSGTTQLARLKKNAQEKVWKNSKAGVRQMKS